jgi:hypothetical protein
MITRKLFTAPTYALIDNSKIRNRIVLEIRRLKPEVEVSVEGCSDLARGKIIDWNEKNRLFTVQWKSIPDAFAEQTGSKTGLRSFFKTHVFTTQLLFKTEIVRRTDETEYQYRIPEAFYQNQRRKALRVPLPPGSAWLVTARGTFPVLDLSVSGAALKIRSDQFPEIRQMEQCELILGKKRLTTPEFGITFTRRGEEQAGCRFHGLNESLHIEIKQFLFQFLQVYFKEKTRS